MAIGTQDNSDEMLSEINMIPFIDVMLVLLIIFIITVPVIKHAVNIDLPQASNQQVIEKPETVRLSVNAEGEYRWNDLPMADAELDEAVIGMAVIKELYGEEKGVRVVVIYSMVIHFMSFFFIIVIECMDISRATISD